MKLIDVGKIGLNGSEIVLGCMRINKVSYKEAEKAVMTSLEKNINFFDHADIYGGYTTEEAFGKALTESKIDLKKIQLITKCGIQYISVKRPENHIKH